MLDTKRNRPAGERRPRRVVAAVGLIVLGSAGAFWGGREAGRRSEAAAADAFAAALAKSGAPPSWEMARLVLEPDAPALAALLDEAFDHAASGAPLHDLAPRLAEIGQLRHAAWPADAPRSAVAGRVFLELDRALPESAGALRWPLLRDAVSVLDGFRSELPLELAEAQTRLAGLFHDADDAAAATRLLYDAREIMEEESGEDWQSARVRSRLGRELHRQGFSDPAMIVASQPQENTLSRYDRSLDQEAPRGRENLRDSAALERRLLMLDRTLDGIAERCRSEREEFLATPRLFQDAHRSLVAALVAALDASRLVLEAHGVRVPAGDEKLIAELGQRGILSAANVKRVERCLELRTELAKLPAGELPESDREHLYEALGELDSLKEWVGALRRAL